MTPYQVKTVTVASLIVLAIAIVGFLIGAQPQLSNASQYKEEANQARQAENMVRSNIAALQEKEAELPKAEQEYKELARQFPHEFATSDWVSLIRNAAQKSNVNITTLSPSTPVLEGDDPNAPAAAPQVDEQGQPVPAQKKQPNLAYSNINLVAEGSPANLRRFTERLSNLSRPILIDNIAFSAGDDKTTLTVSGMTFLMRSLADPNDELARINPSNPSVPKIDMEEFEKNRPPSLRELEGR